MRDHRKHRFLITNVRETPANNQVILGKIRFLDGFDFVPSPRGTVLVQGIAIQFDKSVTPRKESQYIVSLVPETYNVQGSGQSLDRTEFLRMPIIHRIGS